MPIEIICFLVAFLRHVFLSIKNLILWHNTDEVVWWSWLGSYLFNIQGVVTFDTNVTHTILVFFFGFFFSFTTSAGGRLQFYFFYYFLDCFSPLLPQAHVRREFVAIFSFNRWHMRQESGLSPGECWSGSTIIFLWEYI